jgi:hypothetical protein
MVNSSESCPLCERFILRPERIGLWRDHAAATGRLFCSLVDEAGLKRLQLSTESWESREGEFTRVIESGILISLGVFTTAGRLLATSYCSTRSVYTNIEKVTRLCDMVLRSESR